MQSNIIIVGAGISGLYVASRLVAMGYSVILLEKEENIGIKINQNLNTNPLQKAKILLTHKNTIQLIKNIGLTLNKNKFTDNLPNNLFMMVHKIITNISFINKKKLLTLKFNELCKNVLGENDSNIFINTFSYEKYLDNNALEVVNIIKKKMSAVDSYICNEGLELFYKRLLNETVKTKLIKIYYKTLLKNYSINNNKITAYATDYQGNNLIFNSDVLILAIPKINIEELPNINIYQHNLLNNIECLISKPIIQNTEVENKFNIEIQDMLLNEFNLVYPTKYDFPKKDWQLNNKEINKKYIWRNDVNIKNILPNIQQLMGKENPVFIVGDTYSNNQSYIEGSIESVNQIFYALIEKLENSKKLNL